MAMTEWRDFKKKSCTAPLERLQASKSENTPATIKVGQNLLVFQQLAHITNSANLISIIHQTFKLLKPLTTTKTTFDGKN